MHDEYDLTNLNNETKKRTNSKAKGSRFERKVASLFNDRFKTKEFSRTPGSGAFATTHSLPDHLQIYGDLITPKNFNYCIECKKGYKNININHLLDYSSQLWKFINQCEKDAKKCNKEPMVIFQQDRQPILCIVKCWQTHENQIVLGTTGYKVILFEEALSVWSDGDWLSTPPLADYLPQSY